MLMSPSRLPAAGMSGSRSTRASVSTPSSASATAERDNALAPRRVAPAPSRPSVSRLVRLVPTGSLKLADFWPATSYLRPRPGYVTRQHIERHRNNDHREHNVERAAAFREMPSRARPGQSAQNAAGHEQPRQRP